MAAMTPDYTQVEIQDGPITQITLRDQKGLNLLSVQTAYDLLAALKAREHQSELKVLILTGYGSKSFCAGAHMQELIQLDNIPAYVELGQELMSTLEHFPVPVIGAINGYALGAGFSLALACDLRLMSDSAQIGQLAVRNGLIPPFGNVQRLIQTTGAARARLLILTGQILNADQTLDAQLCCRTTAPEALLEATWELAEEIASAPTHAIRWSKTLINRTLEEGYAVGYALQEDALVQCLSHPKSQAIMQGFLNKSAPN